MLPRLWAETEIRLRSWSSVVSRPALCALFGTEYPEPSCALSQMGRVWERQFPETRTQAVNYLAGATAATPRPRPYTRVPAPRWMEEPRSPYEWLTSARTRRGEPRSQPHQQESQQTVTKGPGATFDGFQTGSWR